MSRQNDNLGWESAGVGAAVAAPFAAKSALEGFDLDKKLTADRVKTWAQMRRKMQPGDLMFSYTDTPLAKWNNLIRTMTGSTFYHPSLYAGGGTMHEAGDEAYMADKAKNIEKMYDTVVVRPKVSDAARQAAVSRSEAMLDLPYDSKPKMAGEGLAKLVGLSAKSTCPPGSINCQSGLSQVYPKQIPNKLTVPDEILGKAAEGDGFELLGRVARNQKLPLGQQVFSRMVHPALKWGLLAGVPAALAYNHYMSQRDEP